MKTVKTKAGTELPLTNLKGKDYLLVPHRVLWMREEHANWTIETEFLSLTDKIAIAKATIKDEQGRVLAQGTKSETPHGFADYIEKAETGSVGRALAFCGYGTQFAQELEGTEHKLVDSPIEAVKQPQQTHNHSPQPPGKPIAQIYQPQQAQAQVIAPKERNAGLKADLGEFIPDIGKFKGIKLKDADIYELDSYAKYFQDKPLVGKAKDIHSAISQYLELRSSNQ